MLNGFKIFITVGASFRYGTSPVSVSIEIGFVKSYLDVMTNLHPRQVEDWAGSQS
jgi:hypothetical protein